LRSLLASNAEQSLEFGGRVALGTTLLRRYLWQSIARAMTATQVRKQICKVIVALEGGVISFLFDLCRRRIVSSCVPGVNIFSVRNTGCHPVCASPSGVLLLPINLMLSIYPLAQWAQEGCYHVEHVILQIAIRNLLHLVPTLGRWEVADVIPVDFLRQSIQIRNFAA
jgi:hypothetical protein